MLFANPATLALIGKPLEDVIGRTDAEFLADPDAARQVMENDRRIMESGETEELEEVVPRPDGTPRTWWSRKTPYRDETGRVAGLLGVSRDVTDRKLAERELRASEERFRRVVENMSEGLMLFDEAGNLTYQNPASLRIHGFEPDDDGRIGRERLPATWVAWDETGREITFDEWPVSRVFRDERFQDQVLHVRRVETGQAFYASYNGCPIHDADGKIVLGFITIREITAEIRSKAALQEKEEIARASLDAACLGTWRRNLTTGEVRLDERAAAHYGFTQRAVSMNEILARVHPDDLSHLKAAMSTLAMPGTGRLAAEYRVKHPDGSVRWLSVHARVLQSGGANPAASVLGTSQDITERKRAERALQDANAHLREADQRKNEFLAVLSHELRNPLTPIRNSVYILARAGTGGDQARRSREVIERQTEHLTRLTEDLLDVTRISRGKIMLHRTRVDLASIARATAEDHRPGFASRGVALELDVPDAPAWVDGDPTRLAQVVGNLLANAAKFTPPGGTTYLRLDTARPGEVVVRVCDTGAGMSEETLRVAFDPFVQAEQTIERTRGGLGLGLALVRTLVELHGGTVTARSAGEGAGSEFTVTLPALPQAATEPTAEESPRAAAPHRVLVIEDNVDAAESLREALELGDHAVALAHSGPEGIEMARRVRPEVVFCDIGLPGMDGYAVAHTLRHDADPGVRRAFLVALSGYALPEDVAKARSAGFDRHVAKPPSIDQLERIQEGRAGAI